MQIDVNRNYAVITGDIIGFKRLGMETRKGMYRLMARCSEKIRNTFTETVAYDISMFRGDGWQMLVTEPKFSLRAALFVRAFLIAASPAGSRIDTRMAIGIGRIDYIPEKNVTAGDGEAFRASGKRFDRLGKTGAGCLVCENPGHREKDRLNDLAKEAGRIADNWDPDRAEAFLRLLELVGKGEIAKKRPEPPPPTSSLRLTVFDRIETVRILTLFETLFYSG